MCDRDRKREGGRKSERVREGEKGDRERERGRGAEKERGWDREKW